MTIETVCFSYGENRFVARVERRRRKTMAITVHPDCSIEATVPLNASQDELLERLKKRARWIKRQVGYFEQYLPRTTERRYVSGETHLYLGRQYLLKVRDGDTSGVEMRGIYLFVTCKPGERDKAGELLWEWYRERTQELFPQRLAACMASFRGEDAPRLAIRTLKKRWGSLAPSGLLTLNLDLIRAPVECIDYVIIHELCHLAHPHHGKEFFNHLSAKLPDWQRIKRKLELKLR